MKAIKGIFVILTIICFTFIIAYIAYETPEEYPKELEYWKYTHQAGINAIAHVKYYDKGLVYYTLYKEGDVVKDKISPITDFLTDFDRVEEKDEN